MRLLFAILIVVMAPSASLPAQTQPIGPLQFGELIRMRLPMERVEPTPQMKERWAQEPHWSFGPFDEGRFGFRSVTVTVERVHLGDKLSAVNCLDDRFGLARLIVELERPGGREAWTVSELSDRVMDCDTGSASWSVMYLEGPTTAVTRATPEPSLPIFRVAYDGWYSSDRTHVDTTQQLVVDVRTLPPTIAARLEDVAIDGYCISAPEQSAASCKWDGQRQDFLCSEMFRSAVRYSWMMSGEPTQGPGLKPPHDLAAFVTELVSARNAVGRWAEPADVGAVRLIAELPGRTPGRRLFVFGADDDLDTPFVLAVRDGSSTQVVPVTVLNAAPPAGRFADEPSGPFPGYRIYREPPGFTVRKLIWNPGGPQLLRVVADDGLRSLYHLAVEDGLKGTVAQAIHLADSDDNAPEAFEELLADERLDACDYHSGGFASPGRISVGPVRIAYDIEPDFVLGRIGLERLFYEDQCVASATATWRPGEGFTIDRTPGACSKERFRAAYIRSDGSVEVRTRWLSAK
jgi:hypothetical protein